MSSRRVEDLALILQKPCLDHIHQCKLHGIDLLLTCTYRSNGEQAELYASGRTKSGLVVTHAMPGQSPHNCTGKYHPAALAYDVVPIVNGKPDWATTGLSLDRWMTIGALAIANGIVWGGQWRGSKRDFPHFEIANWREKYAEINQQQN